MKGRGTYPADWPAIAKATKDAADWHCIRCGVAHGPIPNVLTVHHWDGDKSNAAWWNLLALCQRCHLRIQGRVSAVRPWVWEHSAWFRPYVAGFYAWHYLGESLDREEVMKRLDELLGLEVMATIGREPVPLDVALRRSGAAELPGIEER